MTLVGSFKEEKIKYAGRGSRFVTRYEFRCDRCQRSFVATNSKRCKRDRHYCSVSCVNVAQRLGELVASAARDPQNVASGVQKARLTFTRRHGGPGTLGSPVLLARARNTMKERYGDEFPQRLNATKEKVRTTNLERWGHACPLHSDELAPRIAASNVLRWGTSHPVTSPEVRAKREATMLERYGVRSYVETGVPAERLRDPAVQEKRIRTLKRNGGMKRSKAEVECYDVLRTLFGPDDVEHTVIVNGWSIDMHVRSVDVYVQFDGVYPHGLDRSIEAIRSSTKPNDAVIHRTWLRDREQEAWFRERNRRLVRLTDVEWCTAVDKKLLLLAKLRIEPVKISEKEEQNPTVE